jgi:hypothetical protein
VGTGSTGSKLSGNYLVHGGNRGGHVKDFCW